jgi:hypothetical protein
MCALPRPEGEHAQQVKDLEHPLDGGAAPDQLEAPALELRERVGDWHAARRWVKMSARTRWPGSRLAEPHCMNAIGPPRRDWLPRGRLARRTRGLLLGGVWLRWVTRRQAHELDEQLASGTDPITSDELSLRAGQLGSARSLERFACILRGAVALAEAPFDPFRLGPPVIRRAQVQENRELLLELAERLRGGGSLGVQGLAITSLLVGDGVSPLYSKAARSSLNASVNRALLALDECWPARAT